jgi:hypothetical protein
MEDKGSIAHKLLEYGVKAALVAGTVYGLSKIYQHYQKDQTEQQVEDKPEVAQAMALYSAMNPSGVEWMRRMDGSDTTQVFNTAGQISDLKKVMDAYDKLYNSSLLDDLRQELSPEDYLKFFNTLKFSANNTSKGAAEKPLNNFKKGFPLITKLPANLRKTPKDISHWSLVSNIITLAAAGKSIGFATGRTQFDNMGRSNTGTLFIEIQSQAKDTKKPIVYWAASSQLQAISIADYKAHKYPFLWLNQKDVLSGIDEAQKHVVAFQNAPVMDEKFKIIGIASALQMLGYSVMELNDNKGNEYIKFATKEGKQHWVNKKFVQII